MERKEWYDALKLAAKQQQVLNKKRGFLELEVEYGIDGDTGDEDDDEDGDGDDGGDGKEEEHDDGDSNKTNAKEVHQTYDTSDRHNNALVEPIEMGLWSP